MFKRLNALAATGDSLLILLLNKSLPFPAVLQYSDNLFISNQWQ